ncbi:MAG: Ig-like domain repeat protein, partial [Gemmataceae bacterium]|nr:Ig-like domain repeat protein [Gemmataceae bacterium]
TNPSVFGQSVTFTATVAAVSPGAGTPTGTVTFFNGAVSLGTGTLTSGTTTLTIGSLAVGTSSITAVYGADTSFSASTSPVVNQVINPFGAATQLKLIANAAGAANDVAFTKQPMVAILDSFSNTVASSTAPVKIEVSGGDGKATLFGITSVNAVNGIANFSGVGINGGAGQNYTLAFNSIGLTSATQGITLPSAGGLTLSAATTSIIFPSGQASTQTLAFLTGPIGLAPESYTATITWGDGTPASAGTVVPPPSGAGPLGVTGTHLYARTGDFTTTVTASNAAVAGSASTTLVATVITPNQSNQVETTQFTSLPPFQPKTGATIPGASILYVQPSNNPNPVGVFLANFRANPQDTAPTLAPQSFVDIRITNPSNDGSLVISLPFTGTIGQGSPYIQFSNDFGDNGSSPYQNVISSGQLVVINYVTQKITIQLDRTSFPLLSNLSGTVFAVVSSPAAISPNTITIVQASFSPNLVTMILPSPITDANMQTRSIATTLNFQTTTGTSLTLAPLQSSTRALVTTSRYGGTTNDQDPDPLATLLRVFRETMGNLGDVAGQALKGFLPIDPMPLIKLLNQFFQNPQEPKPELPQGKPQEEICPPVDMDNDSLEAGWQAPHDLLFTHLKLPDYKPEPESVDESERDLLTAPAGCPMVQTGERRKAGGLVLGALCASYLLENSLAQPQKNPRPGRNKPSR